jgi:hypothetical protein
MFKDFINKKLETFFIKKCDDYMYHLFTSLRRCTNGRSFGVFLRQSQIDLNSYLDFSPEKCLQDYLDFLNREYLSSRNEMLNISIEKFYSGYAFFYPELASLQLIHCSELLEDFILNDSNLLIRDAHQKVNKHLSSQDGYIVERVH